VQISSVFCSVASSALCKFARLFSVWLQGVHCAKYAFVFCLVVRSALCKFAQFSVWWQKECIVQVAVSAVLWSIWRDL
jgi:hypothetical protein